MVANKQFIALVYFVNSYFSDNLHRVFINSYFSVKCQIKLVDKFIRKKKSIGLYLDLINPFYQFSLEFSFFFLFFFYYYFLLELSHKFFKSLDEDAFLKLLQVHYDELL